MAYHQIEPIPDHNWLAGMIASTQVNLWSTTKTTPDDFIPRPRPVRVQSTDAMLAHFGAVASAVNQRPTS